jgi:hypothetical protein
MYCRAVLPTAGLGNKLFPWARCRVYALQRGIRMLAPTWTQVKPGPWLRGDRDKRLYHNLFSPAPPGYISGVHQLWVRLLDRQVVLFKGAGDHFATLTGWDQILLAELKNMTRQRWLHRADEIGSVALGVHVRRGDFVQARSADDFIFNGAVRTPLQWFVQSIEAIRDISGNLVPAIVVSDATDAALRDLLSIKGVERADTGSAVGDLLVLARARMLIGSGGSSFSAWAAFLGQMPTVAFPGQSLSWFNIAPSQGQYIGEWSHSGPIPPLLQQQIQTLFEPAPRVLV